MSVPGLGHRSYVAVSLPEVTYGTYLAPVKKFELISADIAPDQGVILDPSLYAGVSRRGIYQGGLIYRGKLVLRLNYDGLPSLLKLAMGTSGYTKPLVGGENTVYDQTFKESQTLPSASFELSEGDVETGFVQRIAGVKVPELVIRGQAGQGLDAMLQAELSILAKTKLAHQTPTTQYTIAGVTKGIGTPTLGGADFVAAGLTIGSPISGTGIPAGTTIISIGPAATTATMSANATDSATVTVTVTLTTPNLSPVLFHQSITFDDGLNTQAIAGFRPKQFELTISNPLADDRFYFGSVSPDEPIRSDFLDVRWRFTTEAFDDAYLAAVSAFTNMSPQLLFQDPATIGGSSKREFEIRSGTAKCIELGLPVSGYGVIEQTHTLQASYDATDLSAVVIRNRTLDAS